MACKSICCQLILRLCKVFQTRSREGTEGADCFLFVHDLFARVRLYFRRHVITLLCLLLALFVHLNVEISELIPVIHTEKVNETCERREALFNFDVVERMAQMYIHNGLVQASSAILVADWCMLVAVLPTSAAPTKLLTHYKDYNE